MKQLGARLSLGGLIAAFWRRTSLTWAITLVETALLAALPLLIGRSIDGLLTDEWRPFAYLIGAVFLLLTVAVGRRVYDTRVYGSMRAALGSAIVERAQGQPVSAVNARLTMGRELVDFLEEELPLVLTATIQVIASVVILFSFDRALALSAGAATATLLLVYGASAPRFFRLNRDLNAQAEEQVTRIESGVMEAVRAHLLSIRRHEVRLSDTESIVYGLIFGLLMAMLAFNLWFAATRTDASPGEIFSIVTYSYEFMESAVALPIALQSLTRIAEITERINAADAPAAT